jgi:hypothetical protein
MYSYYVYYRVSSNQADECEPRIRELLGAMRRATGVQGRLMKKRGEPNLWMEVYEGVADDAKFEWELAEAVARLKIQECLMSGTPRHIECFEDGK